MDGGGDGEGGVDMGSHVWISGRGRSGGRGGGRGRGRGRGKGKVRREYGTVHGAYEEDFEGKEGKGASGHDHGEDGGGRGGEERGAGQSSSGISEGSVFPSRKKSRVRSVTSRVKRGKKESGRGGGSSRKRKRTIQDANNNEDDEPGQGFCLAPDSDGKEAEEERQDAEEEPDPVKDEDGVPAPVCTMPSAAIQMWNYVFRYSDIRPEEWARHKKNLEFYLLEDHKQKMMRIRNHGRQKVMCMWAIEHKAFVPTHDRVTVPYPPPPGTRKDIWCSVPVQYGLEHFGVPPIDNRFDGVPMAPGVRFERRLWTADDVKSGDGNYDQQSAKDCIMRRMDIRGSGGMVWIPTGAGKTDIALSLACERGLVTLIECHSDVAWKEHWPKSIQQSCPSAKVVSLKGGPKTWSKKKHKQLEEADFILVMMQTHCRHRYPDEMMRRIGTTIIDECHKTGSPKTIEMVKYVSAGRCVISLSGTVFRKDGTLTVVGWYGNKLIYKGSQITVVSKATRVLPVHIHVGTREVMTKPIINVDGTEGEEMNYLDTMSSTLLCADRLSVVMFYTRNLLRLSRRMLVFSCSVPHLRELHRRMQADAEIKWLSIIRNTYSEADWVDAYRYIRELRLVEPTGLLQHGSTLIESWLRRSVSSSSSSSTPSSFSSPSFSRSSSSSPSFSSSSSSSSSSSRSPSSSSFSTSSFSHSSSYPSSSSSFSQSSSSYHHSSSFSHSSSSSSSSCYGVSTSSSTCSCLSSSSSCFSSSSIDHSSWSTVNCTTFTPRLVSAKPKSFSLASLPETRSSTPSTAPSSSSPSSPSTSSSPPTPSLSSLASARAIHQPTTTTTSKQKEQEMTVPSCDDDTVKTSVDTESEPGKEAETHSRSRGVEHPFPEKKRCLRILVCMYGYRALTETIRRLFGPSTSPHAIGMGALVLGYMEEVESPYIIHFVEDLSSDERGRVVSSTNSVILTTYQMLATGTNIPSMDTLLFTSSEQSYITCNQAIGRLRPSEEGKISKWLPPLAIDFCDTFGPFPAHRRQRHDVMTKKGNQILEPDIIRDLRPTAASGNVVSDVPGEFQKDASVPFLRRLLECGDAYCRERPEG